MKNNIKFIINRESLLTPLQHIVGVIEKRQTMPILANVLLFVQDGELTLTGTDLEIQIVARTQVSNGINGSLTIPARKLLDLCRLLPNQADISLEQEDGKVKVTSNKSRFILNCLPAEQYPEFTETGMDKQFTINTGQFKKTLEKTIFCMANQDVRYYLNGLLINISNKNIKLVSSDGHRLAVFEDTLTTPSGYEASIILPRKGVLELYRLLTDLDSDLTILFSNNNIRITTGNLVFSAKLVDAKYPDFSKVFQQKFYESIVLAKQEFKDALNRISVLANEKFKGVTLDITKDNLHITTHNPENDEGEENIAISYPGDELTISFNAQYLLDAVTNLDSDTAMLTIAANASSCFINDPEQNEYKFIVMPMRL